MAAARCCRRLLLASCCSLAVAAGDGPAAVVPLGALGELHVCSDRILRVVHLPDASAAAAGVAAARRPSLVARADWPPVAFNASASAAGDVTVETAAVVALFSAASGRLTFADRPSGRVVLREGGHSFTATEDLGRPTWQVEQTWLEGSPGEGLYGGGSYQNGLVNFKNAPVEMIQFNTEAVVPFFWSTEGYGILWDNYAWTYLNPPEKALIAPRAGGGAGSAAFRPEADGDHFFFVGRPFPRPGETPAFGCKGRFTVEVNVSEAGGGHAPIAVVSWDGNPNLMNSVTGVARGLKKGVEYAVSYTWSADDVGLYVQGPEYRRTALRSFVGDAVDYYYVHGGSGDGAVAGYRELTGAAPLYAKWAYGFWQCKEHYDTQEHLLEAAHGFRSRGIPVDAIVQDWHYWGSLGWGPQWDTAFYPDPAAMVKELKSLSMRLMVSVWSRFDEKTTFYRQMSSKGWLLGSSSYYDAWNPSARELFYNFSKTAHFSIGVDALWLDATEPEGLPNSNTQTYLGSANALMNTYSLMTTQAIADGLRRDFPEAQGARVFSLTRSSFAGQQRTGAALWSGDTGSSWDVLRRQVASSINYQMSGIPYWSEDIGGFFRPGDQYSSAAYRELLTRWFQFGVFTPLFRVHGAGSSTELWNYGEETMHMINASAVTLRYRLLPYIYSGFARVELEGYTMQRGLAMDFADDERVRSIADQFMFGDALLVAPILAPATGRCGGAPCASQRSVYLPAGTAWVNFHSGEHVPAGEARLAFGPAEAPVLARAGSVVALGPAMQSAGERGADPLEVRVYRGADATFTLWEDDGASRAYQAGRAAKIRLEWSESRGELAIGAREGSFDGMLVNRTLHVVWVAPGHGVGVEPTAKPDAVVRYDGARVVLPAPRALVV